jgi:hypothetical protein
MLKYFFSHGKMVEVRGEVGDGVFFWGLVLYLGWNLELWGLFD